MLAAADRTRESRRRSRPYRRSQRRPVSRRKKQNKRKPEGLAECNRVPKRGNEGEYHGKKLAIAVIHGIGSQTPGFADEMIEELKDRVDDLGKNSVDIAWRSIFWANIPAPAQEAYLRAANANNDLDYIGLRRFIVSALSDATAYRTSIEPGSLRDALRALFVGNHRESSGESR